MREQKSERCGRFVEYALARAKTDTGYGARMRRADNPDTEYQAWGDLAAFVDLEKDRERLPFALIGAALCRAKPEADGRFGIGAALSKCYEGSEKDSKEKPGAARLRKLLACSNIKDICQALRPLLPMLAEKSALPLSYAKLLTELLCFESRSQERIKRRWDMQFFGTAEDGQAASGEEDSQ